MQLKATQNRIDGRRYHSRDYESDHSSDDKSEHSTDNDNTTHNHIKTITPSSNHNDTSPRESRIAFNRLDISKEINALKTNGFHRETRAEFSDAVIGYARNNNPRDSYLRESRRGIVCNGEYPLKDVDKARDKTDRFTELVSPPENYTTWTFPSQVSPVGLIPSSGNQSTRISPLRVSPSMLSPPKKESSRGFHISTILGLDDEKETVVAGQQESKKSEAQHLKEARTSFNGQFKHNNYFKHDKEFYASTTQDIACKRNGASSHLSTNTSNMDDIKTSFAHILQGLTATVTNSIDKRIDTFFKEPSTNM